MGHMGGMDPRGMWGTWERWTLGVCGHIGAMDSRGMWGTWARWTLGVCGVHGRDGH